MRNCIGNNIMEAEPNDWVIISDLDEIPTPKKINSFAPKFKYAFFEQKFLSFKFNILNKSQSEWYGSRICVKKFLKSPQWLRNIKIRKRNIFKRYFFNMNYKIISEGGWHFSNIKSPEKIIEKTNAFCHGELNQEKFKKENLIKNKIEQLKDIYDREIKYEKIDALDIPYENKFDCISFKSVMGILGNREERFKNIDAQKKMIINISKALKKGGYLIFEENLF